MKGFWKKYREYIISSAIALGVGALSAIVTSGKMADYEMLQSPPLSPPPWVFPVVWTILYILMGISAAIIYRTNTEDKKQLLYIYAAQLIANFIWPILFFGFEARLLALFWLIFLIFLVVYMVVKFHEVSKTAASLNIPYVLWLLFAFYLNLGTYLLNR